MEYGEEKEVLLLIVVKGNGPNLLGRNWLTDIYLDWEKIATVTVVQGTDLPDSTEDAVVSSRELRDFKFIADTTIASHSDAD